MVYLKCKVGAGLSHSLSHQRVHQPEERYHKYRPSSESRQEGLASFGAAAVAIVPHQPSHTRFYGLHTTKKNVFTTVVITTAAIIHTKRRK